MCMCIFFLLFLHFSIPRSRYSLTVWCHIRLNSRWWWWWWWWYGWGLISQQQQKQHPKTWILMLRENGVRNPTTQVHFDDVSLYGTPKEELLPNIQTISEKMSSNFLKNQLQSWFQPTDNRLAMKLFGSKKALVKERIRQKTAGHWVIHPCSSFR